MEEPFKQYVKEHYMMDNEQVLLNPTIMQMIFSLEWYDIRRTAYSDLIEYHPYLTKGDYDKLYYCNFQHRVENSISFVLFSLVTNRLMTKYNKYNLLKKRYIKTPTALLTGGILTYIFNYFILRPIYLHDIEEMGLAEKYFFLDLDADMM